jgi:cyclopropane fatty-acyl-phospholipid synthase-like methyltransferase
MTDPDLQPLFDAAAQALTFNSPMDEARAGRLVAAVLEREPATVVDIGCGRGRLLVDVARASSTVRATGLDNYGPDLVVAREQAKAAGVDDRVEFVMQDAAKFDGTADAVVCIAASHVFGDLTAMLRRLRGIAPRGRAVVGDGFFIRPPDRFCLKAFGNLPRSLDDVVAIARGVGWTVRSVDTSTMAEWDDFEGTWRAGVESVGTKQAMEFSALRREEYEQHYRGVLQFAWLVLDL